jgi:hypothetical protein
VVQSSKPAPRRPRIGHMGTMDTVHVVLVKQETAAIRDAIEEAQAFISATVAGRHGSDALLPDEPITTAVESIVGLLGGLIAKTKALEGRIALLESQGKQ